MEAVQGIVSSVRQISAVIEELARKIHSGNNKEIETVFLELEKAPESLRQAFPGIEKDKHFQHFTKELQEFRTHFGEGLNEKNRGELAPHLENIAAKMLAAVRDIHVPGSKPGPFAFIGRLFR